MVTERHTYEMQVHRLASISASRSIHSCLRWQPNRQGTPCCPLLLKTKRFPVIPIVSHTPTPFLPSATSVPVWSRSPDHRTLPARTARSTPREAQCSRRDPVRAVSEGRRKFCNTNNHFSWPVLPLFEIPGQNSCANVQRIHLPMHVVHACARQLDQSNSSSSRNVRERITPLPREGAETPGTGG